MAPQFTVVVTTYNRPALLTEALASVQAQTCTDFECIVVDDASETARAALPDDRRFRVLDHATNLGSAAARNTGIAAATGDAVAFLDDDDLWTPDRLEIAATGLADADIALCGAGWVHRAEPSPTRILTGNVHDHILDAFVPNVGRTAVRRSELVAFDPSYNASEDLEWWLRLSRTATVTTVDRVGHLSRRHDGERNGNGIAVRIESSRRLLREESTYFASHSRARAFRLYRIGMMHLQLRERRDAGRALRQSMQARPSLRAVRAISTFAIPALNP